MTADQQAPERRSLQDLLTLLDEDDADGALLDLVFESAARKDPELPDLLHACAIPRTITVEVVGVLRGARDDDDRNRALLDLVYTHSFVLSRPTGGYVYHDATREYLLADWQATPEKKAKFAELNEALADFHRERYDASWADERLLRQIAGPVAEASPERLGWLTAAIELAMGTSLHERAYHLMLADQNTALDFFRDVFYDLEQAGKVTITQTLISFMRDFIRRRPAEGSEQAKQWLDYYDARIQRTFPGYDPGPPEAILSQLARSDDTPAVLRRWALDDLAMVYTEQLDVTAAVRTRHQLADLPDDPEDPWNDPLRFKSLGGLYWWLGDHRQTIRYLREAITRSDGNPRARPDIGTLARLDLAGVHANLSEWADAFSVAAEAFVRARTTQYSDISVARSAATRLAQLLATLDVSASDCASAEAIAIAGTTPEHLPAAFIDRIDLLLEVDRIQTAGACITQAETQRYSPRAPHIRFELAIRRGLAAEFTGRREEAEDIYSGLLADLPDRPELGILRLSALTRRGIMRAELGDTDGAIADFAIAREEFDRHGFTIDAASMAARLASAMTRGGDASAAQELLEAARAVIPDDTSAFALTLAQAQAEVAEYQEHWETARVQRQRALDIAAARRDRSTQASSLRALARLYERQSEPLPAAECTRRAADLAEQIAAADGATPTEAQVRAQRLNADGILAFSQRADRSVALELVRRLFQEAASLDPGNPWPALNLSFAYAEQELWEEASQQLSRALDLSPPPLRDAPALVGCLRDYTLSHAREVLGGQDPWDAKAAAATTVLAGAAGRIPDAGLASLRALRALALTLAGDPDAGDACRQALAIPPATAGTADEAETMTADDFADAIAPFIGTVADYWVVDDMLAAVSGDASDPQAGVRATAQRARARLQPRLDAILGLGAEPDGGGIPVVTPIVLEVGEELLPLVNPALDDGRFLYELIPDMRTRIRAVTGVTVPGIRVRPDESLAPRAYRILIDEVTALSGSVPTSASFARLVPGTVAPEGSIIDFHPLTAEPGLWVISNVVGDPSGDQPNGTGILSPVSSLILGVETAIRARLARLIGPQEVTNLLGATAATDLTHTWSGADEEAAALVSSVVPDLAARLRLTWLLQLLAADGVPFADWRELLTAVRHAGGLATGTTPLYRAVRLSLRNALPGPGSGRMPITLPGDYERALTGSDPAMPPGRCAQLRVEFFAWLRQQTTEGSPCITLVAGTAEGREAAAAIARPYYPLVTTLTVAELDAAGPDAIGDLDA